jgi:alpha-methylacyl-CoA racemase
MTEKGSGSDRAGPLTGIRVLDLSALGPGPFASMILADFGAEVISVRRPGGIPFGPAEHMARGKAVMGVNLQDPRGRDLVLCLACQSDILLEGFRPGVMERLGLGPEEAMARNPRLIYGRLTGWGQTGPYAGRAGHDLNYLAISGALGASGLDQPQAPPAFLGDLANGSYLMVMGLMMALFERERTGQGQVIDAAIVDGAAFMLTALFGERASGGWKGGRGTHMLSGAAPFYGTYQCADGRWFAVGAIEPQFYDAFLRALGLDDVEPSAIAQMDTQRWPELRGRVAEVFRARTRSEWAAVFGGIDACGTPVLEIEELLDDPHLSERGIIASDNHRLRAAPAPRLSRHPALARPPAEWVRPDLSAILDRAGVSSRLIDELRAAGVIEISP